MIGEVGLAIGFMSVLGGVMGLGLAVASKKFAVEHDPRLIELMEALPGANCGACGFPGCQGYAQGVLDGVAETNLCAPGGADLVGELAKIMGVEASTLEPELAIVRCQGKDANCVSDARYVGVQSCRACQILAGGTKACNFGCLGFGDCVDVCPFGAIYIGPDKLPLVVDEKCTGCGKCVEACPRAIICLQPESQKTHVLCINTDKGAKSNKVCKTACIACRKCVKACPFDAIKVVNNVAIINAENCRNCGLCTAACPKSSILDGAADSRQQAYIQETCTGCGECVSTCHCDAITGEEGKRHKINPVKCTGCEACLDSCPVTAIAMRDR